MQLQRVERVVQNQPGGLAAGPLAPVVIVRNEDGEPRVAVDLVYLAQGDVADVLVGGVPTDGKDDFAVVTAERLEPLLLLLWLDRAPQADRIHDLGLLTYLCVRSRSGFTRGRRYTLSPMSIMASPWPVRRARLPGAH